MRATKLPQPLVTMQPTDARLRLNGADLTQPLEPKVVEKGTTTAQECDHYDGLGAVYRSCVYWSHGCGFYDPDWTSGAWQGTGSGACRSVQPARRRRGRRSDVDRGDITTDCLLTAYYLLPTTYYLLPATCYLPPATYYLLPTTCYLLPTTCYLLPATCYLLPTTYHLLPTTYYLLPTAY